MVKWLSDESLFDDVVISSRVRLARNIKDHIFPERIGQQEADDIKNIIKAAMVKIDGDKKYTFVDMKDIDALTRRANMEEHIISPELIKNKDISGYIIKDDHSINIMINEEDHIRLQSLKSGLCLQDAYEAAHDLEVELEKHMDFAFDRDFGYLTACPTNTGTGLRASVMAHLPAMTIANYIPGLMDSFGKLGLTVRGVYGEGSEALGDMYQISNQKTLGLPEDIVIEKLENIVYRVIVNERNLRNEGLKAYSTRVKDKVFRALGILKYARKIDEKEAMACLSSVRMGIDLGLIKGIGFKGITQLMFKVQKYSILKYKQGISTYEEEDVVRGNIIREFFQKEGVDGQ